MTAVEVDDEELNNSNNDIGFSWENRYAQSWEILQEDSLGSLQPTLNSLLQRESEYLQKRREIANSTLRRGIMRHLILLLDWSIAASSSEVPPNRGVWVVNSTIKPFIKEFLDSNPLCQISIILLRDGLGEKLTDLSSNYIDHFDALEKLIISDGTPRGDLSLQNGIKVASSILSHVPSHGSREVLFCQIGLTLIDPGNIFDVILELKDKKIRFNVVSLSGEVSISKRISKETGGNYSVALSDSHFIELVKELLVPSPILISKDSRPVSFLVQMGFPSKINFKKMVICSCHKTPKQSGYQCPKCSAFVCLIPIDCPICSLTLISSPHLAKSYHHLFPVPQFHDQITSLSDSNCFGCLSNLNLDEAIEGYKVGKCIKCSKLFCANCNYFAHEILYNCPGCLS